MSASKRRVPKYVNVEASEDSAMSESSVESANSSVSSSSSASPVLVRTRTKTQHELANEMESRYGALSDSDSATSLAIPEQSNLLPTSRSPLLFLLRCKSGNESLLASRLSSLPNSPLLSVVHKPDLKGYLYLESFKKSDLQLTLSSLNIGFKLRVVPIPEMPDTLNISHTFVTQPYARIKSGKYKGDLVQVLDSSDNKVKIRLVPRINKSKQLFNPSNHPNEVIKHSTGFLFHNEYFQDGFLIKNVPYHTLDFDVTPSFNDLESFGSNPSTSLYDQARVIHGDLKGLAGKVVQLSGNIAILENQNERHEIPINELQREIKIGDEMACRGINGIVLHIDKDKAILGINGLSEEIECKISELRQPTLQANNMTGLSANSMYTLQANNKIRHRKDAMINKRIKIEGGRHKGLYGVVKEVSRDGCVVQLSTTGECIKVERNKIKEEEQAKEIKKERGSAIEGHTPGYRTPGYRTPGYRTPGYHSPVYANQEINKNKSKYDGVLLLVGGQSLKAKEMKDGVFIMEDGRRISWDAAVFCTPIKYDNVIVLMGERAGMEGALISVNEERGVVCTREGENIEVEMKDITKKVIRYGM